VQSRSAALLLSSLINKNEIDRFFGLNAARVVGKVDTVVPIGGNDGFFARTLSGFASVGNRREYCPWPTNPQLEMRLQGELRLAVKFTDRLRCSPLSCVFGIAMEEGSKRSPALAITARPAPVPAERKGWLKQVQRESSDSCSPVRNAPGMSK
jgi:hypothetical protein